MIENLAAGCEAHADVGFHKTEAMSMDWEERYSLMIEMVWRDVEPNSR